MTTQDRSGRTKWAAIAAATLMASLALTATAAGAAPRPTLHGTFNETAAGLSLGYDIHGSAKMTLTPDGTAVKINVAGLDPTKTYGSHLHNGTCADGGGGHYQEFEGGSTTPPNELWLTTSGTVLQSNKGGVAHGAGSAAWVARTTSTTQTNARSVIVHEPGGARIACANLA
jgi:hypothetical protein